MRNIFNPTKFIYSFLEESIKKYAPLLKGKLIDVGCGKKPFEKLFCNVDSYFGIDLNKNSKADLICDVLNLEIKSSSADSVLCTQVMEHVKDPEKLIKEISRICKEGALCLLTCPHICRVHGVPYDFFRFTKYGLKYLCEKNNLKIIKIEEIGGFFLTTTYLWDFYLREKLNIFSYFLIPLFNLFYLFLMPLDNDKNYSFNYIVLVKKDSSFDPKNC